MLFTSESVSCGHPDKICDQISDAILDEFLRQDPNSKVACECFITNNLLVIGGEAHTNASVDIIGIAKKKLEEIGYNGTNGFNPETAVFVNTLHEQSSDIRQGVDRGDETVQGAGDQGMMFGFACKETDEFMPLPIVLANKIMRRYDYLRKNHKLFGMRPDAKCQVTVKYDDCFGRPENIDTIVISMQHHPNVTHEVLEDYVRKAILLDPLISKYMRDETKVLINPTGKFVIGGPEGDTGLTGRKIIVDTYGGKCPHGGGAFSGKDPSKVDRSAAYYARYIAKNLVAAGVGDNLTVQLSYAIGVDKPVSIAVYGDIKRGHHILPDLVQKIFNPTPYNIIHTLGLKAPIYEKTATYGHFGGDYSWEKTDKVNEIINYLNENDFDDIL